MPGHGRILHLYAPGLLGPVPDALADAADTVAGPYLRHWLARADTGLGGGSPADLCRGLGVVPPAEGPTALVGVGGQCGDDLIYRAAPCHLRPERNGILLQAGPDTLVEAAEAEGLAGAFNELFAAEGRRLEVHRGEWFLRTPQPLPVDPPPLRAVSGGYLDDFLPKDAAGAGWRAFLTEVQMLFHGSAVSQQREQRGELVINGLWIWGGGREPSALSLPADRVSSDDRYLQGLARLGGLQPESPVQRLSQLGTEGTVVLADWAGSEAALRSGDATGWLAALDQFERAWAAEALAGLRNDSWTEVRLHAGARARILRRGHRRRFWRRPRPLSTSVSRLASGGP
jgi:hypothetical protein